MTYMDQDNHGNESWDEDEGGENPQVDEYRNFIVEMERETEEGFFEDCGVAISTNDSLPVLPTPAATFPGVGNRPGTPPPPHPKGDVIPNNGRDWVSVDAGVGQSSPVRRLDSPTGENMPIPFSPRLNSPPRPNLPPRLNSPQRLNSPPRHSNSPLRRNSPTGPNLPPRINSPPGPNLPPRINSPPGPNLAPRINSPPGSNSPPGKDSPMRCNSPPRSMSPPGRNSSPIHNSSPRHNPSTLLTTPSPTLNRSTSPLCEKPPRQRKSAFMKDSFHVNDAVDGLSSNGRIVSEESEDMHKPVLGVDAKPPKPTMRTFKQRSAQENFGLYGLLTPALCLVPGVDGHDALTQSFSDLCGEHRELKLAAAHIDDAINGRGKWGKARAFFTSKKGQFCFKVIDNHWFTFVVLMAAILHLLLTFFEPPPVGNTSPVVFVLTIIPLSVYAIDVSVNIGFLSWDVFSTLDEKKWIRREFIFLCMFIIDFLLLIIQEILVIRLVQPFRCLRAVIIMCKIKNVGHIFDTVLSIIVNLVKTFFIVLLFIILFSAIGIHVFVESYHYINCNTTANPNCTDDVFNLYTGAFDNLGITALRLFVLLSTENYPEFMIPAFKKNNLSFIYFGIFVFVGVFCLTAILLAIIVDSYWEFAKKHVKQERARERVELAKAWNLMDPLGKGSLPIYNEKFIKLFKILKPQNTDEMNMQLISYLDSNQDEVVDSLEWTIRLNEALSFEFEVDEVKDAWSSHKWYNSMKRAAQRVIYSRWFACIIMMLIVAHCILFCLEWRQLSTTGRLAISIAKSVIVGIFVMEAFLRICGEWKILVEVIEVLDLSLIAIALVTNVMWYFLIGQRNILSAFNGLAVSFRVGFNSAQTKKAVLFFFTKIFPVMFDLIILVFVIMFFYGIIGFELFYNQSPNLQLSSGHYDYDCGLGFNTAACSLLIVFQIVTTSNWHEIMNSAMVSTTDWACLYFIVGFIFINLVVMNLFVAIAIEAFNKLGTEKEMAAAQESDQQQKDQASTFAESAKGLLNNIFQSSRVEEGKDRNERNNQPPGSPRMRRPSRVSVVRTTPVPQHQTVSQSSLWTPEPPEEELAEEEEDYTGLTPQERKRKQLKKKMMDKKKKKQLPKTKVVVVTAYRGTKDQELDLNVGEEVVVIKKQDDWWEGQIGESRGWFPASHVKDVKRNTVRFQDSEPNEVKHKEAWKQDTGSSMNHQDATVPNASANHSLPSSSLNQFTSVVTAAKAKPPRLKLRNTGSWRKEILGDITVMNPEELKELNKILKGQSGRVSLTDSLTLGGSLKKFPMQASDSTFEEETDNERVLSKTMPILSTTNTPSTKPFQPRVVPPKISLERVDTLPDLAEIVEEEEEEEEDAVSIMSNTLTKDTLTVMKPDVPASVKKKQNREKTKKGEMPSWMQKFAQDNKLNVLSDVKFDENGATKEEEDTHSDSSNKELQSLPGKMEGEPETDSAV